MNRCLARYACTLLALSLAAACAAQQPGDAERIAEGITRHTAKGVDAASLPPSLALAAPVAPHGPAADAKVQPLFWTTSEGQRAVRIDIHPGTSLYGTGEIAGPLLRNGRMSTCWNTDSYAYTEANKSLYQSHPWVLAVRPDGTAFGVLADTTWRCHIDLTSAIEFRGEGSAYHVYIIDRDSPQEVIKGLSTLVGTIPLPPLWALGYHQCRYSYNPESRVREIADGFRSRDIPCDVIWFDIDYMHGYRVFTFDKEQFPDPARLNADLGKMGFHRIWMIDPGIKAESGYSIYDQGTAANFWVQTAGGEPFRGEVWPGVCVFPDYTRPEVRTWWAGLYKDFMAQGIDGVWNDMNEPAVFNVASKTMPEDNVHLGGRYDAQRTLPRGPHLQYHNVYGMLMAQGTFEGILAARPDKRPFVLTRAGNMGSHRYAATWTGDNSAEWDDLEASVSMALNLSLSGQPFCGPDIGGFNGNGPGGDENAKLFARWMGFGALLPFARGHTGKGNIDKEPWAFDAKTESTCKAALQTRYRLLPYYYTLFREASVSGLPVMRPVFFADPADPALRSEDDAFLLGSDLLVVPRLTPTRDRASSLPKGEWPRIDLGGTGADPDLPELRIRPGAIIPAGPVMEHTGEKPLDPLTLYVCLDDKGTARGTLYEDAGDGFGYRKGEFRLTTFEASVEKGEAKVREVRHEGSMPARERTIEVIFVKSGN